MPEIATLGLAVDSKPVDRATASLKKFSGATDRAEKASRGLGTSSLKAGRMAKAANDNAARSADRMAVSYGRAGNALRRMATALAVFVAGTAGVGKFLRNTIALEKVTAQLDTVIGSTGSAAGFTTEELQKMSAELQRVSVYGDEVIDSASAMLLTFTRIGNETFPQALEATLNVATAMKTDLKSAAIQVGKALNDPVLGMTALTRSGITFTQAQKDLVKSLVESGDVLRAQNIILRELETQFGNSARAARGTLGGALTSLGNTWGDLFEVSGAASEGLRQAIERLITAFSSPSFREFARTIGESILGGLTNAANAVRFVYDNSVLLKDIFLTIIGIGAARYFLGVAVATIKLAQAMRLAGVVAVGFNAIQRSGIIIFAGLAAGVAYLTGNINIFKETVQKAYSLAQSIIPSAGKAIGKALADLGVDLSAFNQELMESETILPRVGRAMGDVATTSVAAAKKIKEAQDELKSSTGNLASFSSSTMSSFVSDIRRGESALGSLGNALDTIADKLINLAINNTFGAISSESTPSSPGLFGGIAKILGFAGGGYTGNGGVSEIAGVVHGREFVVNAGATSRYRSTLERMNKSGRGYAQGGYVQPVSIPATSGTSAPAGRILVETRANVDEDGNIRTFVEKVSGNIAGQSLAFATPKIVDRATISSGNALAEGSYDTSMAGFGVQRQPRVR